MAPWLLLVCLALTCVTASAQSTCSKSLQVNKTPRNFAACTDLSVQGAKISWTYEAENHTVSVGFTGSAPASSGWVGWGLNPKELAMAGTSTLIAFQASNGSNVLPYLVSEATKSGTPLKSGKIDYEVLEKDVQISGTSITIYAKLKLGVNESSINLVWNRGSSVSNFEPGAHGFSNSDLLGLKKIDLKTGSASGSAQPPHQHLKNKHGVINTVAWGILLPMGAIFARYMKPFADPAWFYLHISFQCTGYVLGVAGWAIGLKLGSYSKGVIYHKHRNIGIALFAMSTLQVMALLLRPNKDNKVRKYWNVYHYAIGYSLLTMGILNIFFGFDILSPAKKWRHAYYGILGVLGGVAIILEIITWIVVLRRKSNAPKKTYSGNRVLNSAANGHDGGVGV